MGSWGTDVFASDDAADLLADLAEVPDPAALLQAAMTAALDPDGYLESPEMTDGLAAAALVACAVDGHRVGGGPAQDLLDAGRVPGTDQLRQLARAVLDRGLADDGTEWAELWAEAGELDDARDHLRSYRALLA